MRPAPVLPGWAEAFVTAAADRPDDASAAIEMATTFGAELPQPARGQTALRWAVLTAVARADLTAARVFEAHTDALSILAEAGLARPPGSWGVFAAESPAARLDASYGEQGWTLTGTKPWCSLGGSLAHALVTAHTADGRRLFAVDLRGTAVRADPSTDWVSRGLRTVATVSLHFEQAAATPVGETQWYLARPGFAWGGIGVAACWLGGAEGLAATLCRAIHAGIKKGPLAQMHLGAVDAALFGARAALRAAADEVDASENSTIDDPALLALRTRTVVVEAVEATLRHVAHALGPAPLGFDADHARRVADLEIYIGQHHAEADLATLGARVSEGRS
jgi:alkylation response protein AidB-like acyl-CoA dehydrogenase